MVIVDLRVLGLVGRRQDATQLADWLFPWMGFVSIECPLRILHVRRLRQRLITCNDIFYDKMTVVPAGDRSEHYRS